MCLLYMYRYNNQDYLLRFTWLNCPNVRMVNCMCMIVTGKDALANCALCAVCQSKIMILLIKKFQFLSKRPTTAFSEEFVNSKIFRKFEKKSETYEVH